MYIIYNIYLCKLVYTVFFLQTTIKCKTERNNKYPKGSNRQLCESLGYFMCVRKLVRFVLFSKIQQFDDQFVDNKETSRECER